MKIQKFEEESAWLAARAGKVTGSRAYDVSPKERGTGYRKGFYELIAERLALPSDGENSMDRGHRLEPEAIERFRQATGKEVDTSLMIWTREDNDAIAVSPDGAIEEDGKFVEGVEAKCLGAATHIEVYLTKVVPKEYEFQVKQHFAVNPDLRKMHLVFYQPLLKVADFFIVEYSRSDVEAEVEQMVEHQKMMLGEVDRIVAELTAL